MINTKLSPTDSKNIFRFSSSDSKDTQKQGLLKTPISETIDILSLLTNTISERPIKPSKTKSWLPSFTITSPSLFLKSLSSFFKNNSTSLGVRREVLTNSLYPLFKEKSFNLYIKSRKLFINSFVSNPGPPKKRQIFLFSLNLKKSLHSRTLSSTLFR